MEINLTSIPPSATRASRSQSAGTDKPISLSENHATRTCQPTMEQRIMPASTGQASASHLGLARFAMIFFHQAGLAGER